MIRALLVFLCISTPALAQQPRPSPETEAIVQLWREAQQREAAALVRAITAEHALAAVQKPNEPNAGAAPKATPAP